MDFRDDTAAGRAGPRWRRRLLLGSLLVLAHLALLLSLNPSRTTRPAAPTLHSSRLTLLEPPRRTPSAAAAQPPRAQAPSLQPPLLPLLPAPSFEVEAAPATAAATAAPPATEGSATAPAANPGTARAPLVIALPKAGKPGEFRPDYNPAAHDPRGNTIKLRFEEKLAIAAGTAQCFLEVREPDGSIWRGPGRWVMQALAGGAVKVCVR